MNSYVAAAPIRKHRCVAGTGSSYPGGTHHVIAIQPDRGPEGKIFAGGQPVMSTENGFRVLAALGLAIGIAVEDVSTPGAYVKVADSPGDKVLAEAGEAFEPEANLIADSEGRVIVARVGVRLSERILAIAMEGSAGSGRLVAVKIAPRGLRT